MLHKLIVSACLTGLCLAGLALSASAAPLAAAPTPTPIPPLPSIPNPNHYQPYGTGKTMVLKFDDEFNGTALDTSKWRPNWLAGTDTAVTKPVNSNELSCYDPKNVSVHDGNLDLYAQQRPCLANNGTTYQYASGLVETYNKGMLFNYGYMEARMNLAALGTDTNQVANWPAFWSNGTLRWPSGGEIDVMEGLGGVPSWYYHFAHGSKGSYGNTAIQLQPYNTGWHVFAADWESGIINWYYDGKLVGTGTNGVVSDNMYLILNYALSTNISPPVQVPSHLYVDYVRLWQKY